MNIELTKEEMVAAVIVLEESINEYDRNKHMLPSFSRERMDEIMNSRRSAAAKITAAIGE